jgi:hypothetical protein
MDELAVCALLERIANEEGPPSRVSIGRACSRGRRRIRLRRVYLPTAAAPVAAAVAVGLIAALSAGVHSGRAPHHSAASVRPIIAPTQFNPLVPYASFGWLPAGYSVQGLANQTNQMSSQLGLTASSRSSQLSLSVFPAGQCRVGGPVTIRAARGKAKMKGMHVRTHYPAALNCRPLGGGLPLTGRAPDVNGQRAYWAAAGFTALAWEYGRHAWALLGYQPGICASCQNAPIKYVTRAPAGAPAMLREVASRVRYGVSSTVVYGFAIRGLPRSWREGRSGSSYGVAAIDGRLVNVGWVAGPAADPTALGIYVSPADIPGSIGSCKYVEGQSRYVTVDGARAIQRTIAEAGKHWQSLCAADVRGVQVLILLDLANPNTDDTPLPGSAEVGSVLTVFNHLRLFGPHVADWTTRPVD